MLTQLLIGAIILFVLVAVVVRVVPAEPPFVRWIAGLIVLLLALAWAARLLGVNVGL